MGHIPLPTIETFSQVCLEATAPVDVADALTTLLGNHGIFSWFVGSLPYVSTNGMKGFGFHSMPEKWLRRYLDAHHFDHDPVFQYALTSRRKNTWKSCRRQSEVTGVGARSLSIFDEAAKFDLTDGLIMPMRGIGDLPGAEFRQELAVRNLLWLGLAQVQRAEGEEDAERDEKVHSGKRELALARRVHGVSPD